MIPSHLSIKKPQVFVGRPFKTLLYLNRPYARDYIIGVLFSLGFMGMEQATPLVLRAIVGRFESRQMSWNLLLLLFSILIVASLLAGVARYWERTLIIRASRKFEYDLRNEYYRRIERLSLRFFRNTPTGDIMARATNDLNYVRLFLGPGVMGTIDMIRLPIVLSLMAYFSIRLTALGLSSIPFISLAVYFFVMYMHKQSQKVQEQFSVVSARAQENLAGARIVKAYNAADQEIASFEQASTTYMRESLKLSYVMALIWPAIELAMGLVVLLVIWRGGLMVIRQTLVGRPVWTASGIQFVMTPFTFADFTGFIVCLIMLAFPIAQWGWVLSLYQRGAASMNRIIEIMAMEPDIKDSSITKTSIQSIRGEVIFDDVTFSYDGEPVLDHVSFQVAAGKSVAIVGPTGSGKSTVLSLICREYDPTAGQILIDGVDIRQIPLRVLRGAIGYAPQDIFLFSDTVRENLLLGKPDASEEELNQACAIAQFTETLERLPQGYDTLLGERGINLSGGQKQRLALARALLKNPTIILLDDSLSSVDTHTEEEIMLRLRTYLSERTSIVVSHRISTIQHADMILVLKDGRIVEQGTHADLLSLHGVYAEICRRQMIEEQLKRT
ncbi:MAG TPA: ABC transporter ATP-binding protein [Candidatus Hydrogenedentes bacterium]|nr:ABC transporter ATP-binding protein [Candidatus Hydrogenedentota bacterium]HOL75536.1 ABC transporter ATP-binding protein [Candidatus Hydrogenedentota bacterium]HPO86022.1 ABC transporter ATP-binding protein [Candidatus Hydrogenedentota bacterium]